jgi:hypothetical protein
MKIEEQRLKIELTKSIQNWIGEQCCEDDWGSTGVIVHGDLAEDMADAAYSVFQAVHKSQAYAKKEGFFIDAE